MAGRPPCPGRQPGQPEGGNCCHGNQGRDGHPAQAPLANREKHEDSRDDDARPGPGINNRLRVFLACRGHVALDERDQARRREPCAGTGQDDTHREDNDIRGNRHAHRSQGSSRARAHHDQPRTGSKA